MGLYRLRINKKFGQALKDSHDLHDWTVGNPHAFWIDLYEYCGIVPALPKHTKWAYHPATKLRDMPTFFPGLKLNYAENVLVNATTNPRAVALIGLREAPKGLLDNEEEVTWSELAELVRITRSALVRHGVTSGQVVAALMANSVWTIVLFLACASAGIIFTSVSPDMGVQGCASRFAQVAPKLLFVDVDLAVRGTRRGMMGKVQEILQALQERQSSRSLPSVIFVPTGAAPHLARNVDYIKPLGVSLHTWLQRSRPSDALTFTRLPTSHPLVIVYSSGTTGDPKCIVSPHISLLNYKKVALLHNSLGPDSTVFQYSSTSWILWNVMNGHLSVGAKIICYGELAPLFLYLLDFVLDPRLDSDSD
jgi:acetoacetyl-CoA synthetase